MCKAYVQQFDQPNLGGNGLPGRIISRLLDFTIIIISNSTLASWPILLFNWQQKGN